MKGTPSAKDRGLGGTVGVVMGPIKLYSCSTPPNEVQRRRYAWQAHMVAE